MQIAVPCRGRTCPENLNTALQAGYSPDVQNLVQGCAFRVHVCVCVCVCVCALRGPAVILFVSRDTCSDSIANSFVLSLMGYRTIIARYVAKWGIAQMGLCEIKYKGRGVLHHFGGVLTSLEELLRYMGYRSASIAISRDMEPPRVCVWRGCGRCSLGPLARDRDRLTRRVLLQIWVLFP